MNARFKTWLGGLTAGAVVLLGACTDQPTSEVTSLPQVVAHENPAGALGWDLNHDNDCLDVFGDPIPCLELVTSSDGYTAKWYFPTAFPTSVGTGVLNPFLKFQGSEQDAWPDGAEEAFNTNTSGNCHTYPDLCDNNSDHTKALALNHIPIILDGGASFRQLILDLNESNANDGRWRISIDLMDVWLCEDPNAPNYDQFGDFESNGDCDKIWDLGGRTGFGSDALTSGSGKTLDYNILIPEAAFLAGFDALEVDPSQCPYMGPDAVSCGIWVIVHAKMGFYTGDSDPGWASEATPEEFSTIIQPWVEPTKTATPEFHREYKWTIEKSVTPTEITLFGGQSDEADYTVTVTPDGYMDSGWTVSGAITITNPSPDDVNVTEVTDYLLPGPIEIPIEDCSGTVAGNGGTLICDYSYEFSANPNPPEGDPTVYTNNVEVTLEGLTIASGQSAPFSFSTPTSTSNEVVHVTDTYEFPEPDVETALGTATWNDDQPPTPAVFNYDRTLSCSEDDQEPDDEGTHHNTAEITETGQQDDATVTVNCLDVDVSKDANTSLERTYKWLIDKSVTPDSWALFDGDDGTSDYVVTVTPDGYDDASWAVEGTITIHNPNDVSVYLQDVSDEISPDIDGNADCSVTFPYELAADATLYCDYSATLPDGSDRTNTATVSAKPTETGQSKDFTGDANVDFTGVQLTEVNKTIHVTDTYPSDPTALGTADWDAGEATFDYSRTFYCGEDEGPHGNTATITETGQDDDANVDVDCYDLDVSKTAETTFTRTWTWSIDKVIDPSCFLEGTYDEGTNTATVAEGETLEVCYEATIDADYEDSDWYVSGDITITNNHPGMDADLTEVTDVVSPDIDATVDCPSLTVPAGGELVCTYEADLPNADDRTNVATATQQNYSYDSDLSATPAGTTDYDSPPVDVTFDDTPDSEIDECVDVDDLLEDAIGTDIGSTDFGTYCADQPLPHTFEYSYLFGPDYIPLECDNNEFYNTASFITNDTGTTGSDDAMINIFVECGEGCTLTLGYWKTHSEYGPAPYDDTWALLPNGADTPFFDSGQSWYEVFWTNPQGGNAYYILAHQYEAAVLNILNEASAPTEVTDAISQAEDLFNNYTPSDQLRGRNGAAVRQLFIELAGILGDYNTGDIGPGHCTENPSAPA